MTRPNSKRIAMKNPVKEAIEVLATLPKIPEIKGSLKVWWIPQVPGKPYEVPVPDIKSACIVLDALTFYDWFQLANNIKPDFSNAGGLCIFDGEEWNDWEDDDGNDINHYDRFGNLES